MKHQLPKGFLVSTGSAGIKRPGRADIALIYSETDAACAGVFTQNRLKGNPVKLDIERVRSGKGRAIVANSGNANVANGPRGLADAKEMARIPAKILGVPEELVYVCSTGVIGAAMPMEKIRPELKSVALRPGSATLEDAAQAIMTTDKFPKMSSRVITVGGKRARLTAIAKGAGMIHPNMATMLCFIISDINIGSDLLDTALRSAAGKSFNRLTVDGDTSTSDTILIMANGLCGNPALKAGSREFEMFSAALDAITLELARMIASDGEGASRLIEVVIKGAASEKDALTAAYAVAKSPLVKTAVYGNDANWGRIMAAIGYSGAQMEEDKVDIWIERLKIVGRGVSKGKDKEAAALMRTQKAITITADLHLGDASERVLTCDLTEEYVKINAEYRT
ncbi:MAG: bifunctional glutamate N-acetyltransferase/amino-acid acetyltransferase ArgJ [Actinomycetota bacterium]|nr:bifunctional glutamate N-acetyltransferase/amino-acid acetyltransferase ArgJ [Actinomycetota bacterium]